jgi:RNA polymerase sigma-70 factor (ECF subfamily)
VEAGASRIFGHPLGQEQVGKIPVMVPSDQEMDKVPVTPELGPDSARWLQALADTGPRRESAVAELHAMLVRAARREVARRGPHQQITGPELEDLAYQAAGDALLAITQKIGQFRGESRFTTWAYKFVVFEVSAKIGRHFWRNPARSLDAEARQREVFVAIVLNGVPLDALVVKLGSNRNAIYKMMFDARRKLRAALAANGYLNDEKSRRS